MIQHGLIIKEVSSSFITLILIISSLPIEIIKVFLFSESLLNFPKMERILKNPIDSTWFDNKRGQSIFYYSNIDTLQSSDRDDQGFPFFRISWKSSQILKNPIDSTWFDNKRGQYLFYYFSIESLVF